MSLYLNFYEMSPEGAQGLLEQGFVGRRTQTAQQIEDIGGKLHSWHLFANGDWDIAAIMEFPDDMDSATVVTRLTTRTAHRTGTLGFQPTELPPAPGPRHADR